MSEIATKYNSASEEAHAKKLQGQNLAGVDKGFGKDLKSNSHTAGAADTGSPTGSFSGDMMDFTFGNMGSMMEALRIIAENTENMESDIMDTSIGQETPAIGLGGDGTTELLETLNEIFTPILIKNGFESDVAAQIQEECYKENTELLLERSVIKFDEATKMAQLQSVCALLLARQKGTSQYKAYENAARIARNMKLEIQKTLFAEAKALATQYLVKVSTTGNSSIARNAAQSLMPETQH